MIVMIAGMALLRLRAKSSCVAMPSKVTHSRQSSEFLSPYNVPSYPAEFSTFESEADAEVRFSPIEAVIRQDSYSSRRTLCISGSVFGATDDALLVAAYLPKPNYFSQTEQFQRVEMMVPIGGVRFSQGAAGEARRFELTYPLPANANLNGDPSAVTVVLFDGDRRPIQQNRVSIRQTPTFGKSSF